MVYSGFVPVAWLKWMSLFNEGYIGDIIIVKTRNLEFSNISSNMLITSSSVSIVELGGFRIILMHFIPRGGINIIPSISESNPSKKFIHTAFIFLGDILNKFRFNCKSTVDVVALFFKSVYDRWRMDVLQKCCHKQISLLFVKRCPFAFEKLRKPCIKPYLSHQLIT